MFCDPGNSLPAYLLALVQALGAVRTSVAFGGAGATGMVTCGRWVARELDRFGAVEPELGG
ncbi:MAG: hypothetical protein CBB71_00495 [Rhodopirellula sp. TMED11]|nr:MAG: hypothetical protein CBB71_00495 [Rhodopirellula sp. TMED11]